MHKVFVTRRIPSEAIDRLKEHAQVKVWPEQLPPPKEVLLKEVEEADGLLSLLTDPIDKEVLSSARRLKVVGNYAVGFNNIDIAEATGRGIVVTNTPDVLTETTADLAFGLMMAAARKLVVSDSYVRSGYWKTWDPLLMLGRDIYGATIGIIGMGRIGQAMARRAHGFNMRILYYNRGGACTEAEEKFAAQKVSLDELLIAADFVSIHVPLTPSTTKLIGAEQLKLMKKEAILINTARGQIIDEQALVDCLINGTIAGAGLDVFEEEPIDREHPLCLLENVVLAPHIGSASIDTRTKMGLMAANGIIDVLLGRKPETVVNPEVYKE